jgi:hypothetical protein
MAETRPEPFAQRAAMAGGVRKVDRSPAAPAARHILSVPACAVPIFVFLHIPKTAGTTMRGVFNEMFGTYFHLFIAKHDEKRDESGRRLFEQPDYFDNIMMLAGHFPRSHAVVRAIAGRRIVFVSVMRDPVKRVISHYDYLRRMPWHPLHHEIGDRTLLQAFSAQGQFRRVCENEQLRIMFGNTPGTGHEAVLAQGNHIIGTLENLAEIAQAVAALSGMPPAPEIPRYNQIEDLRGKTIVRAKDQPDFAEAVEMIRAANEAECVFYDRVKNKMIYTAPDWQLPPAPQVETKPAPQVEHKPGPQAEHRPVKPLKGSPSEDVQGPKQAVKPARLPR